MINSRGAALWSYGIVMIIKDQSEVLIFTTTKNSRFGMYIPSPELGESIHTLIKAIIDIGASMNHLEIEKTFLKNDEDGYKLPALASLIDEINELQLGCVLPKETLDKIDVLCEEIKNFSLNQ